MKPSISLIIPMLNEAHTLPELLAAINAQTRRPDELIFVDAGSTDMSREIVTQWWARDGWQGLGCHVITLPGAYPGAGRNAGIREAKGELLAFIDAGIDPDSRWLEELEQFQSTSLNSGVFGVCRFIAQSNFQRAVCALTNGLGAVHPVIPASLFKKEVFNMVGDFPENLRAAEDLLWVTRYERHFGVREVCWSAEVCYRHFPKNLKSAFRKWQLAEYFSVLAGVRSRQQFIFLISIPMLYVALLSATTWGTIAFSIYIVLRGVGDPLRRSHPKLWWGSHPASAVIALGIGPILDIAKVVGTVRGLFAKFQGQPRIADFK